MPTKDKNTKKKKPVKHFASVSGFNDLTPEEQDKILDKIIDDIDDEKETPKEKPKSA